MTTNICIVWRKVPPPPTYPKQNIKQTSFWSEFISTVLLYNFPVSHRLWPMRREASLSYLWWMAVGLPWVLGTVACVGSGAGRRVSVMLCYGDELLWWLWWLSEPELARSRSRACGARDWDWPRPRLWQQQIVSDIRQSNISHSDPGHQHGTHL